MNSISTVDNLMIAYYKARRGKSANREVMEFSKNLSANILRLREELVDGNVKVGEYTYFEIHDPKRRLICAASFRERVLHHAIINVCKPYFERHLIYDTYATREGKGIYAAIDKARHAMKSYPYVAKLDVRKYFDSIDHAILKDRLRRIFKDPYLLKIFDNIVDSYSIEDNRGVPIGNLTSQYFANYYLSSLDHHIKEVLRVPCYVRYMDDMLVFGTTQQEVNRYVREIDAMATDSLGLTLKTPQISACKYGVSFLGYKLFATKILLNRRSKLRFVRRMKLYAANLESGIWSEQIYFNHITPLLAFAQKAYTRNLRVAFI